jgi:hypothetical protein
MVLTNPPTSILLVLSLLALAALSTVQTLEKLCVRTIPFLRYSQTYLAPIYLVHQVNTSMSNTMYNPYSIRYQK